MCSSTAEGQPAGQTGQGVSVNPSLESMVLDRLPDMTEESETFKISAESELKVMKNRKTRHKATIKVS